MDNKENDDSQSYDIPWGKFCSSYFGDTISTTTTPRSSALTPPGKEYLCFQTERESDHTAQCAKSREFIKVLKAIIDIELFEQKCVIINGLLQS